MATSSGRLALIAVATLAPTNALLLPTAAKASRPLLHRHANAPFMALSDGDDTVKTTRTAIDELKVAGPRNTVAATALLVTLWTATAEPAMAAAPNAIPSALAAYGHYLGLVLTCLCLATERLTVKENMTEEEEDRIAIADTMYGVAGLLVVVTGYLRVTQYGKGWEFYAHSPIFWVKMLLVAVMGAASFFPTTKIIQRSVARKGPGGEGVDPMSAKLASRMTSIINAELLAIASIPLAAAMMARGVGYADWLPWQAGAAPVALALFGLGYKYIKEALDWTEGEA